jgi:hypothetical protein
MKKLKKFNSLRYNSIIESINNIQDNDFYTLMEKVDYKKYQFISKKIASELKLNLFYLKNYNVSISALYPVIATLVETGSFKILSTSENIVLITICALTVLVRENKEKAQKLFTYAEEKGISQSDIDKVINQISTIKGLFTMTANNFGKTINTFSDMLESTNLLVPFLIVLESMISQDKITSDLLILPLSNLYTELGDTKYKLLIHRIMHKLEIIMGNTTKFQNPNNIKPLLVNDELKPDYLKSDKVQIDNNHID